MGSESGDAARFRLPGLAAAAAVLALPLAGCADVELALRELVPASPPETAVIAEPLSPLPESSGRLAIRAEPFPLPDEADVPGEGVADEAVAESEPLDAEPVALDASVEGLPADGRPEGEGQPGAVAPEAAGPWVISPAEHGSLRMALEDWTILAGWHLDWRAPGVDFRPSARAVFEGAFLDAVGALLDSAEIGGRLRAEAYAANRWLVVRETRR